MAGRACDNSRSNNGLQNDMSRKILVTNALPYALVRQQDAHEEQQPESKDQRQLVFTVHRSIHALRAFDPATRPLHPCIGPILDTRPDPTFPGDVLSGPA